MDCLLVKDLAMANAFSAAFARPTWISLSELTVNDSLSILKTSDEQSTSVPRHLVAYTDRLKMVKTATNYRLWAKMVGV
jgi:hypothetical protein